MDYYILDDEGEPVPVDDVLSWASWFETSDRVVWQSVITRDGRVVDVGRNARELRARRLFPRPFVSTVFLSIDHDFTFGEDCGRAPVLWETMIFGGPLDDTQWRYRSRLDAVRGHALACELVRRTPRVPRYLKRALQKYRGRSPRPVATVSSRERRALNRFFSRQETIAETLAP